MTDAAGNNKNGIRWKKITKLSWLREKYRGWCVQYLRVRWWTVFGQCERVPPWRWLRSDP